MVCDQSKAVELIQVAYEIDSVKAYVRETSSLIKASAALLLQRDGSFVTFFYKKFGGFNYSLYFCSVNQ